MNRLIQSMKFVAVLSMCLGLAAIHVRADDWQLTDGTVYRNVHVLSHDDSFVTITHDEGGGKIPLRLLNPDLQKQFGYDPNTASGPLSVVIPGCFSPISQAPSQPSTLPALVPNSTPPAGQPAPAAKPEVNVQENNAQIADDQQQLDNVNVDIKATKRDIAADKAEVADSPAPEVNSDGVAHASHTGNDTTARLMDLLHKKAALEADIKRLQDENASASAAKN